jgi:signal peptidase
VYTDLLARFDYRRWGVVVFLAGIYFLVNLGIPRIPLGSPVWTYLVQAACWGAVGAMALRLPHFRPLAKIRVRSYILQAALIIGFCQVMLYVIGGFFSGFGKSPSSFTPRGILVNLVYVGFVLAGMELSRAWLVNRFGKHHQFQAIVFVSLLYTLLGISLGQLISFKLNAGGVSKLGSEWLPLLAENLLASLLALQAGVRPALAYRGMLAAFWWCCPVLPDLDWGFKAIIGVAVPISGMLIVNRLYVVQHGLGQTRKRGNENAFPLGWILTTIAATLLVWFAVGVFPIKPSVIPTGSMVPVFNPGDIVLVAKISPTNIKLGDIIEYRTEERINIVHRVIEIQKNGNFITKGDANNTADSQPVDPRNVNGRVILKIPKIGWLSIAIKQFLWSR